MWGLGLRLALPIAAWGFGFVVLRLGFKPSGVSRASGFGVLWFGVSGLGHRIRGLGFGVLNKHSGV